MELALLAIGVGVGVGIVVGALGAGGGILAVPVLVFLLGMPAHSATASSLIIVLITALVSLPHHARHGNVEWRNGLVFAGVSVVGAFVGSRLSSLVPASVLLTLFGVMLVGVAVMMLRRGLRSRAEERAEAAAHSWRAEHEADEPVTTHDDPVLDQPGPDTVESADGIHRHHGEPELPTAPAPPASPRLPLVLAAATVTGFLTGFFGVGGGFIVVPMLVIALGLAMRRASGTSLLVMVIATAASLLARLGTEVQIDWATTLIFAGGSAVGGLLGGPLSTKARPSTLTLLFSVLLGGVAAVTLAQTLL
ncbi:sulfite exporter TauE/SafE family protein [Brachybacterium fresconis]|uniref:Probable membrane transporter protein n=1 Tax=Brachybacterium fresconis TaxID=173363 RepID=A0ABS4YKQ5_9MICO|nr:sulfite exporter TauE/SafE family protein [Brachybacterium fresconis]MBP2409382.1 putative membrane protein YfcA [Brachybacterium fresconis]